MEFHPMKTWSQAAVVLSIIGLAISLGGEFQFNARVGIMLLIALLLAVGFIIHNLRDKNAPFQREQDDLARIIKRMDDLIMKETFERRAKGETITTIVHNLPWFHRQFPDEHPDLVQQAYLVREQRRTHNL
jgi:hypothetical protein